MTARNFDPVQQFAAIKKSATDAVKEIFPVDGKQRTIRLVDCTIDDTLNPTDYKSQVQSKEREGTWGAPVYANLELVDKATNKVVDKAKVKLFTLPKLTDRFSYIVSGNEYQVHNQLRLKSGVYTLRKQNGELKTQVNLAKGKNFDLAFNERTGLFTIQKVGGGQANVPLYPLLTHLGISPSGVATAWGSQLQQANSRTDPKAVSRAESAFGVKPGELKDYFAKTVLNPETTKTVLGQGFERVDGPLLLAAAKNLLQVHLGEKEPTDRDSLAFKELHSVEDFIHERIQKNKQPLAFKLRRNVDNMKRTKLSQIVNPGAFQSTVETFFTQDDKSATPEQTNPLEMLSGQYLTTIMGSGGIGSDHAVTQKMREIHPSHYGFMDPVLTPESSRVGVNLHLPMAIQKDGKDLKTTVIRPGGRSATTITPAEAYEAKIAFPNQLTSGTPTVKVQYHGTVMDVPRGTVDYFSPAPSSLFSWSTNLIPFLASTQGNRSMMAGKMLEQAIALKHREAPLVQVGASPTTTFEGAVGNTLAIIAPLDGVVKKITPDLLVLRTSEGDKSFNLYNNFTLNRKSFMNHEPLVKVGDKVKKGQVLADSNFTKGGTLALGTNMRVAYLPYLGLNHEDGIVITESAADKLTSEHIHKKTKDLGESTVLGLSAFKSFYPNALSSQNLAKLDDSGVIKKGQTVRHGEALAAVLQRRAPSPMIGIVNRALSERPKDASLYWTQEDDGHVLDVQKTPTGITVFVKTEEKARIGDKLSGRYGNKGVVVQILPDKEAPKDANGKPVEILLNPHGVISRINVGQIYESALGKAALKTGKTARITNFTGENYLDTTKGIIDKAGTPDKEELFDPTTGKSLGKVHVGNPYILKLSKQGTVNYSVRQGGPGNPYDATNRQPLKAGGEEGAKAMDVLTTYAMLAHGARANLREMGTIKGDQNDEFWKALKSGQPLPPPKAPFVYDKFMGYLRAAGIDVKKDGSKLTLAPLTDRQVHAQSSGEIENIQFYRGKGEGEKEPMKGGFFDQTLTGGYKGEKWNHIDLHEPVVNPVFEVAVSKLTGLGKKYDDVVAGKLHLDPKTGEFNTEGKGLTGGRAVEHLLKQIDVDAETKTLLRKAPKATGAVLDDINKRLRYLEALRVNKLRPEEAYIRKAVPILPPVYRPIYPLPDGSMGSSDINYLYQHAGVLNTMAKLPVMDLLAEEEKAPLRSDLHQSVKAIAGLTDLPIKGRTREGFISEIKGGAGGQPKEGFFISKMISKKQDFVGRGVIIGEPDLGIDEMAMPEEMAWKLFEPFVVRELKNHGKNPLQAQEEIKKKTPLAKQALDIVMAQRHVLLNRAPSLHKFSIMAFKPKITSGRALKLPPLVFKGFSADLDGDQQLDHVLVAFSKEVIARIEGLGYKLFKEGCAMTARFKEQIPAFSDGEVFMAHLSDFPHGKLIGSKEGAKGRIDFYEAIPGTKVLALDETTNSVSWQEVSAWSKHYAREVEIVTLQSGRQIMTDDDPRAVYGIARGTLRFNRFTPSEAMALNVFVPRADRLSLEDKDAQASISAAEYRDNSRPRRHMYKNIPLGSDFGYLIGAIAGNGWTSRGDHLCFANTQPDVTAKFETIVRAMFNGDKPKNYTFERKIAAEGDLGPSLSSAQLYDTILPLVGHGARNKHLPPFFLNAPLEFREGLLAGLMDTDGSISTSHGKAKPQLCASYSSSSLRLVQEVRLLASTLGMRSRIVNTKTPAGEPCWALTLSNIDVKKWNGKGMVHAGRLAHLEAGTPDENSNVAARYDIIPISYSLAGHILKFIGAPRNAPREHKSFYITLHRATKSGSISRIVAKRATSFCPVEHILTHADGATWLALVEQNGLAWDQVESVDKTGIREDGYDLTVPGYETFMNVEGIILSNTMTVHAPITAEANAEAAKMLPSRNLFQPGTGQLMIAPSQEAQVGLFYLSKTPAGKAELAKIVGPKFPLPELFDKKGTATLLYKMAKEMTAPEFATAVAKLKHAGDEHAYNTGFTLGIDDLIGIRKDRDVIVAAATAKAAKTTSESGVAAVNKEATALIDKAIDRKLKDKNNPLYDMVESGARGSRSQLRSILATPLFMTDASGKTIKTPIKNSYSEGLDVGDYWTSMYGARTGAMMRSIQTSLPGAFNKDVMATTIDNVITANDCGTKDGVTLPLTDTADALDRYTAGDQPGVPHNTLVNQQVLATLKARGAKTIKVRSPLTCHRPKGICAHCHGLDEHSKLPELGDNVGAKAGQTISEPLIQIVMNVRHTGGVAGARGSSQAGYQRIDQLLKLPKIVVGAAALAPKAGKVTSIEKGLAGGFNVTVGDTVTHVENGLTLKVKQGDKVTAGDPLSDGVLKPQDLVRFKGMQPAQQYIVDELHKAYHAEGVPITKRIFETVVRSLGNTTTILNNSRDSGYLPGDTAPYTVVQDYNRNLEISLPVEEGEDHKLAEATGGLRTGHTLTASDLKTLRARGITTVKVTRDPIVHAPFLKGITTLPLLKKDWMSSLGYRYLAKSLTSGASEGWSTDVAAEHPIPSLAHAATFGQGKEGKY